MAVAAEMAAATMSQQVLVPIQLFLRPSIHPLCNIILGHIPPFECTRRVLVGFIARALITKKNDLHICGAGVGPCNFLGSKVPDQLAPNAPQSLM